MMKDEIMAQLNQYVQVQVQNCCNAFGFPSVFEANVIGRETSTHFKSNDARQVLEFFDTSWNALYVVAQELDETDDDKLKSFDDYLNMCLVFNADNISS